jgi:hypothetical protein
VVEFERAWDQAFADMPVVTLCAYVVAEMSGGGSLERLRDVSAFHDGVLVQSSDRELALFEEASRA